MKAWHVKVWDERSGFPNRSAEWIFTDYAAVRAFSKHARKVLGFTPEDTAARYPSAGIDITPIKVYETTDAARKDSWPFHELQEVV